MVQVSIGLIFHTLLGSKLFTEFPIQKMEVWGVYEFGTLTNHSSWLISQNYRISKDVRFPCRYACLTRSLTD